jgi:hypothetical protein
MLNQSLLFLVCTFLLSYKLLAVPHSDTIQPLLFSDKGKELIVEFNAEHSSQFASLAAVNDLSDYDKLVYKESVMVPLMKYLFGPLTHRSIGGVKSILEIEIDWTNAHLKNSMVILPYHYKGLWMIEASFVEKPELSLPIPKNEKGLLSTKWKKCTDSDPDHQTESFYWYFWDPERHGCDHQEGVQFDLIKIELKEKSLFTELSYPEYKKMIKVENGRRVLKATFAFGYIEDLTSPLPDTDPDIGVAQFRKFISELKNFLKNNYITEDIYLSDYKNNFFSRKLVIGKLFKFQRTGVDFEIKVVTNAGVDQMDLFAKSFAHDHDSYFAWLGHSRVGSGFDAQVFRQMLFSNPSYYTISKDYQLVFWGGCNSYSYYADPFFKIKAAVQPEADPGGTKGLDIIANALPSLFILNSKSALVHLKALLDLEKPVSYQEIIRQMEMEAASYGTITLAVVLGDEDNGQ